MRLMSLKNVNAEEVESSVDIMTCDRLEGHMERGLRSSIESN